MYRKGKYAFVSDFNVFTFEALWWIYLDVDVELIKPLDDLLVDNKVILGFERIGKVAPV